MERRVVELVALFKQLADPAGAGSAHLGGYVDDLLERPYGLGAAQLAAYCRALPAVRDRWELRLVDLVDSSGETLEGGSGEEALLSDAKVDGLLAGRPAAVCFSAYCWNVDAVLRACGRIRQRDPEVVTVVGGRAADDPAALLAADPAPDHVVVGEAEVALGALLAGGLEADAPIPGVWRRRGGEVLPPPGPAEVVEDLDTIPSPHLEGLARPSPRGMMLELARGCPNRCGYCAWSSCKTRRRLSEGRVEDELRWAVEAGVRHVTIVDAALGYEPDQIPSFVAALRRADPDRRLSFTYNLRHELVTDAEASLLREVPSFQVLIGMETLSARPMELCGRAPVDPAGLEAALDRIATVAPPVVGVVLGLPGDDLRGFVATMEHLARISAAPGPARIGAVLVSLLQVLPGTPLAAARRELGLVVRERGVPYLVEHPTFPREDLRRAVRFLQWLKVRSPRLLVKGPEGLSTLLDDPEAEGLRLLGPLIRPWKRGSAVRGWTLGGARPRFDGEGFGSLLFLHPEAREPLTVRLDRRDEARPCYGRTRLFNVYAAGPAPAGAEGSVPALLDEVLGRVTENEARVLGRVGRER